MMTMLDKKRAYRPTALLVAASMAFPVCFMGCGGKGGGNNASVPPPVDDTRSTGGRMAPPSSTMSPQQPKQGMSTGKKAVIVLAGAALLYYLYKHHEKAKEMAQGKEVQYYQSKNGRIYYRDPQTHQAHWVTPPSVELSDQEAQEMSRYKGYNNSTTGEDYAGAAPDNGAEPQ